MGQKTEHKDLSSEQHTWKIQLYRSFKANVLKSFIKSTLKNDRYSVCIEALATCIEHSK